MNISVQIGYYPLSNNFNDVIMEFIDLLHQENIPAEVGPMSTIITGNYNEVMDLLKKMLYPFLERYPSVFTLTISNSCNSCIS
jgi:uncharacterized protein YqgV (UPF0045/DUF77 family)